MLRLAVAIFVCGMFPWHALAQAAHGRSVLVAYVQNGDLWVRDGSEPAARLTRTGSIAFPRFSADGSEIAFLDRGELCVISVAKPHLIRLGARVDGNSFRWSPAGNVLAVWDRSGLSLYDESNSWARDRIIKTDPARSVVLDAAFGPDGERLVVARRRLTSDRPMDLGTIETVEWRRPSPASRILSQPGNGFALYGWLRDDTILFWSDPSFSSSFAADGLELDAISAGQRKARSLGHVRTLVYRDLLSLAPDGKSLLATLTTSGGRETWEDRPLAVIDLANGARRIVSPLRVSTLFPAWSPGGDYIAYVQAPVGTENKRRMKERKIWVMRRDGSERQQVTRDQAYRDEHPVWVSGDTILFCRIGAAYRASLWSISKSGANLTRIAGLPTLPDEAFGFYGYVDWGRYLDVWADGP